MRASAYLRLAAASLLLAAGALWLLARSCAPVVAADPFEAKIYRGLAAGHNVVFPGNLDEHALRWKIADLLPTAPDLAVFGSSHGLRVGAALFGGRRLVNFSISGAALPDHLITSGILARRHLWPKVCLVFADPWLFDKDTDFGSWRARAVELARMENAVALLSTPPVPPIFSPHAASRDLSVGYLGYSLAPIAARLNDVLRDALEGVFVTDASNVSANLILPDGSILPPADRRLISAEESRDTALRQLASQRDLRRYGTFARLDTALWQQFENWLKFLQRGGTQVVLVLPPYHPAIYREILRHPDNHLVAVEARVRLLAYKLGTPLVGSYDPVRAGVGPGDFQDGDHLLEAGLRRLFALAISTLGAPATAPAR